MSLEVTRIHIYKKLSEINIEKKNNIIFFHGKALDNRSQSVWKYFNERTDSIYGLY